MGQETIKVSDAILWLERCLSLPVGVPRKNSARQIPARNLKTSWLLWLILGNSPVISVLVGFRSDYCNSRCILYRYSLPGLENKSTSVNVQVRVSKV